VVSATNKNLEELIGKDLFREDLYYRLAVARVEVPSLTVRRDDIVPIAIQFLLEFSRKFDTPFSGISREAQDALRNYRWKGNVRELRNFVERGVLVGKGPELTLKDLGLEERNISADRPLSAEEILHPLVPPVGIDLQAAHKSLDQHFFREVLRITGGNETRAALLLRINYHTFRYRRKIGALIRRRTRTFRDCESLSNFRDSRLPTVPSFEGLFCNILILLNLYFLLSPAYLLHMLFSNSRSAMLNLHR
jgi:DNA-binding NtrC family response regulator